jgi:hypothetical protein
MRVSAALCCLPFLLQLSACTQTQEVGPATGGAPATGIGGAATGATGPVTSGTGNSTTASGGTSAGSGGVTTAGTGAGATMDGGSVGIGGAVGSGGTAGTGGAGAAAGTGGTSETGGDGSGTGGESTTGGGAGAGTGGEVTGPGSYALPPPSQCHNRNYIDYQAGCVEGDANSTCGGKCNVINPCQESTATKPHADMTFICPRFMLFGDEMLQAAKDDGNEAFNYAIVGHDVDGSGIDGNVQSTCCQCYQLVFAYPGNDRQALLNPDDGSNTEPGVPVPPPLIVQSFNTAATPTTFDVYMAAGGFGANNACDPNSQMQAAAGVYMYTQFPSYQNQSMQGAVKPASDFSECKTEIQWVTTESFSSEACRSRVEQTCSEFASSIPGLADQAILSCNKTNSPDTFYHLNWAVYVKKVECPTHLTEVTGCKLANQGLDAVAKDVTTAEQAKADSSFLKQSSSGKPYEITTMEDCCRPSCAATDWVTGKGLEADGLYNAFYSCDANGVPITEPE